MFSDYMRSNIFHIAIIKLNIRLLRTFRYKCTLRPITKHPILPLCHSNVFLPNSQQQKHSSYQSILDCNQQYSFQAISLAHARNALWENIKGQYRMKRKQTLVQAMCVFWFALCVYFEQTENLSELSFGTYRLIFLVFSLIFSIRNISYFQLKQGKFIYVKHKCKQYFILKS